MIRMFGIAACLAVLIGGGFVPRMVAATTVPGLQSPNVIEHGGRTDKNGCHVDRKTGIRHCH